MDYLGFVFRCRDLLRRVPVIFWLYRQYVITKGKLYLSHSHLSHGKKHSERRGKPVLAYLEMHLVTHCNLKCKGCSQFSPIADKWFADIKDHERDMIRLKELFSNIETIRFVGGEPLLHPEIDTFLSITRKYFPRSNLCIATNGSELKLMKQNFWNTCRANHIKINWTVYPPLFKREKEILRFVKEKGIIIVARKFARFRAIINLNGDSSPEKAIRFCRSLYFCPFLRQGSIYICSRPVVINTFNNRFGTNIPAEGSINIHDPLINGWDVLISISRSSETCRYCATRLSYFDWTETQNDVNEWNIA